MNTLNERVGQLEDRDCSGTSAPLHSHHDDNDDSESNSANQAEQEASPIMSTSGCLKFNFLKGQIWMTMRMTLQIFSSVMTRHVS